MIKEAVIAVVVLVGGLVIWIVRLRRLKKINSSEGCLSCGSEKQEVIGDKVTCLDCGYQGSSDRGGKLSTSDIGFLDADRND